MTKTDLKRASQLMTDEMASRLPYHPFQNYACTINAYGLSRGRPSPVKSPGRIAMEAIEVAHHNDYNLIRLFDEK